jgi:hypothetical protein
MSASKPIRPRLSVSIRTPDGELPAKEQGAWEVRMEAQPWRGPGHKVHVRATWHGPKDIDAGLVVHRDVPAGDGARVLVPSLFYGDNGPGGNHTHYPRLGALHHENFTSPTWDFVSERSALPAVFLQQGTKMPWLAVEPAGTGIGFDLSANHAELRVHAPGIERPYTHDRKNDAPSEPLRHLNPGESLELDLWYGTQRSADARGVAQVQRSLQRAFGNDAPRSLDVKRLKEVCAAARDGLVNLHFRPELGADVLVETVSFDKTDIRPDMHVGWISGSPAAFALLQHGLQENDSRAAEVGRRVLDTVCQGLSPSGFFWGELTPSGWKAGWNGASHKLQARTLAEATLFLLRALELEPEHDAWRRAAKSNLDQVLRAMNTDGHPGSFYDAQTGAVLDRRGTGGLLWAATLVEAARILKEPKYQRAAERIGEAYATKLRTGDLGGAPEDIGLAPSSEDGYNALLSSLALYESTRAPRWLELARLSADWLLTFRWSYDVKFPEGSELARRGFRTRGADGASPTNNHLHNYGMIASDALVRLSALTHDRWYEDRAQDHLAAFMDAIATRDHQFGGTELRGMMAEQMYTANWRAEHRAGDVDPQSHAWVLGLTLLAGNAWRKTHPAI